MATSHWIKKYLSEEQIQGISKYVQQMEKNTAGEIVPVIVRRSSAIRHVPLVFSLLAMLVFLFVESSYTDFLFVWPWQLSWILVFIVFYFLGHLLMKSDWILRLFVPDGDEIDQVHQRAHLEFYENRVFQTQEGTGILIFISAMEKRAVIWADPKISSKVPQEEWDRIVQEMVKNLRANDWNLALREAIHDCGKILSQHFPLSGGGYNELQNGLIIKE